MALVASEGTAAAEKEVGDQKAAQAAAGESQAHEKRGLHDSIGDWSFGGHDDHHHHEHVKTITIEKKVPVPYHVTKHGKETLTMLGSI